MKAPEDLLAEKNLAEKNLVERAAPGASRARFAMLAYCDKIFDLGS